VPAPFLLHWTAHDRQSWMDTTANSNGLGIYFVDTPVSNKQKAPIRFTFYWTQGERWEGRDYEVKVR
jgi:glucoamylase